MRWQTFDKATGRGSGVAPGYGLNSNNARRVACPKCGARPVASCRGKRGPITRVHDERKVALAESGSVSLSAHAHRQARLRAETQPSGRSATGITEDTPPARPAVRLAEQNTLPKGNGTVAPPEPGDLI